MHERHCTGYSTARLNLNCLNFQTSDVNNSKNAAIHDVSERSGASVAEPALQGQFFQGSGQWSVVVRWGSVFSVVIRCIISSYPTAVGPFWYMSISVHTILVVFNRFMAYLFSKQHIQKWSCTEMVPLFINERTEHALPTVCIRLIIKG